MSVSSADFVRCYFRARPPLSSSIALGRMPEDTRYPDLPLLLAHMAESCGEVGVYPSIPSSLCEFSLDLPNPHLKLSRSAQPSKRPSSTLLEFVPVTPCQCWLFSFPPCCRVQLAGYGRGVPAPRWQRIHLRSHQSTEGLGAGKSSGCVFFVFVLWNSFFDRISSLKTAVMSLRSLESREPWEWLALDSRSR